MPGAHFIGPKTMLQKTFLRPLATALVALVPAVAQACPGGMETLVTCQIAGSRNILQACFDRSSAYYSFGPSGAPDLVLQRRISEVQLDPWPGMGRVRAQGITFFNGGYAYSVSTVQDRYSEGAGALQGGVEVTQNGRTVASLTCGAIIDYGFLEQTHPYQFN